MIKIWLVTIHRNLRGFAWVYAAATGLDFEDVWAKCIDLVHARRYHEYDCTVHTGCLMCLESVDVHTCTASLD